MSFEIHLEMKTRIHTTRIAMMSLTKNTNIPCREKSPKISESCAALPPSAVTLLSAAIVFERTKKRSLKV